MDQVVDDEAPDERERYPDNRQREREAKRRKPVGQWLLEYNSLQYETRERAKKRGREEKKI